MHVPLITLFLHAPFPACLVWAYHPSSAPARKAIMWGDRRMSLPWTDSRLTGEDGNNKFARHHLDPITGKIAVYSK